MQVLQLSLECTNLVGTSLRVGAGLDWQARSWASYGCQLAPKARGLALLLHGVEVLLVERHFFRQCRQEDEIGEVHLHERRRCCRRGRRLELHYQALLAARPGGVPL